MAENRSIARLQVGEQVVIIGAGPAGLTAAYELTKRGVRVLVLESDDVVGGISRTVVYKGYRFDIGGHRFFTKVPAVEAIWREILGSEMLRVRRLSRIHYNGRLFDYPLKPFNALMHLGPWTSLQVLFSYFKWQRHPYPVEENFEQWVTNRFGRRLYEIFFKTYTEKVWGVPCTEIRAEWAAQRIQGLSLMRALLHAASLNRRPDHIKTLIHEFWYPRFGPGQMWEACRDRVVDAGGQVLMSHRVVGLELRDGRIGAVRVQTPDGERCFSADHVISTMPLRALVRALGAALPESTRISAEHLKYRDFLVVALILKREHVFSDNWIYVHTPGVKVGRIQNFKNWSAAMVPDPSRTCLGMEYFCFKGDSLWESSDSDLVREASWELEELGFAHQTDVLDGTVIRMPKAYPIYDSTYRAILDEVRQHLDSIPNLHSVGRNGMHKYNNQDHSMLTAMMAVGNLYGANDDLWEVNTDFDYHEEQRIERSSDEAPIVPDLTAAR